MTDRPTGWIWPVGLSVATLAVASLATCYAAATPMAVYDHNLEFFLKLRESDPEQVHALMDGLIRIQFGVGGLYLLGIALSFIAGASVACWRLRDTASTAGQRRR